MLITELLNQYRDLVKYMMKLSGCADYISLTDLARHKSDEPNAVIANWMRNRNTIEYLGIWEQLYNPNFKPTEFEGFRIQAGLNAAPTEQA